MNLNHPTNIRFQCNRCAICCGDTKQKTRHILMLESEAKQINEKTMLPITGFSEKIKDKFPFTYEIKKTSEGKCVFLKNNQCTIYSTRPLICRFYPFELKDETFSFTLECPQINKGKSLKPDYFKKLFNLAQEKLKPTTAEEHQPAPK